MIQKTGQVPASLVYIPSGKEGFGSTVGTLEYNIPLFFVNHAVAARQKENKMEEQKEKLQLSEYLGICVDIQSGKMDPEAGDNAIRDFCSKLVIKSYMKHKDKIIAMSTILYRLGDIDEESTTAAYLEMNRVMYGLLGYCVNLDNNLDSFGGLFGVYDAIREFGLYDYVLKYCREDFELFSTMLRDAINISHIKEITQTMSIFNDMDFDKWVGTLKDFKEEITPEVLQGLIEFGAQTDGATQKLLHSLAETAVSDSEHTLAEKLHPLEMAMEKAKEGSEANEGKEGDSTTDNGEVAEDIKKNPEA